MIDFILWASTKAAFANFARTNPPANPLQQQDADGNWFDRRGFTWVWWAESGKMMTAKGTYDQDGNEITPPSFLPGFVALCRIHGDFFHQNRIEVGDPDYDENDVQEQWGRNRVARYIKTNGTPGTMGGIPYYEVDGVRMFRPADVTAFLAANNLPGHEWLGGNSF